MLLIWVISKPVFLRKRKGWMSWGSLQDGDRRRRSLMNSVNELMKKPELLSRCTEREGCQRGWYEQTHSDKKKIELGQLVSSFIWHNLRDVQAPSVAITQAAPFAPFRTIYMQLQTLPKPVITLHPCLVLNSPHSPIVCGHYKPCHPSSHSISIPMS